MCLTEYDEKVFVNGIKEKSFKNHYNHNLYADI